MGTVTEQHLWQDIAAGLRDAITSGQFKPGATLPAEKELGEQYGVSRDTVRRALNRLTQEGLLTPGRGRLGRQVRTSKRYDFWAMRSESQQRILERRASGRDAWISDAADQELRAGQSIAVAIDEAAAEVASRLQIAEGELVVVRRRIRTINGLPHNANDTYYPMDIAQGTAIMDPADVTQGTIALMRDLGYVQTRYRDDLETRMPDPDEADRLQIPPGVPVLVQYRTGYTEDGRPVKLTITTWPGDRTSLIYDFPA